MDSHTWQQFNLYDQLGAVGTEIGRTITWRTNPQFGNPETSFYRGLEYLDLTINDPKNLGPKLKELCRTREVLVDWYFGSELYATSDEDLNRYFEPFAIASNLRRAKLT